MALSLIQQIKLELGLVGDASDILSDEEIQYFLDKNKNSIKKASLDSAKTVLFILSQQVHERSGTELELYGNQWFENYMKSLELYINNPNFSITIDSAKAYAGGISVSDIRSNINNCDNFTVDSDVGIPKDFEAATSTNTKQNIFNPYSPYFPPFRF